GRGWAGQDGEAGQEADVHAVVLIDDVLDERGLESPSSGRSFPAGAQKELRAEIRKITIRVLVVAENAGLALQLEDPGEALVADIFVGSSKTGELRGIELGKDVPVSHVHPSSGQMQPLPSPPQGPFHLEPFVEASASREILRAPGRELDAHGKGGRATR